MIALAIGFASILGVVCLVVVIFALRNGVLVRIGVRNIPRRATQSVLITLGLMLSATIIAASLGVGDIVNYSIERAAIQALGHTDVVVRARDPRLLASDYFPAERVQELDRALAGKQLVDGVLAEARERAPVVNRRVTRTEPRMAISGLDPARTAGFGSLRTTDGRTVQIAELGPDEVYINASAQRELEARSGDVLDVVPGGLTHRVTVRGVVRDGSLAGSQPRMLMTLDAAQLIFGHPGQINRINISNTGDEWSGVRHSAEVIRRLRLVLADPVAAASLYAELRSGPNRAALAGYAATEPSARPASLLKQLSDELDAGTPTEAFTSLIADPEIAGIVALALESDGRPEDAVAFSAQAVRVRLLTIDDLKTTALANAERVSDGVTRLFLVFGSFSIIVGLLLIFLIFVLLAAARRTEMGVTRAIGARRRQLVQIYVYEGLIYAVGAAAVGTVAGVLASMLLVEFIPASDQIGFTVARHIEPRSLTVAFTLGLILTIATVAFSAYRVSRMNVVAAIRGIDESARRTRGRQARRRGVGARRRSAGWLRAVPSVSLAALFDAMASGLGFAFRTALQGWPLVVTGAIVTGRGMAGDSAFGVRVGGSLAMIGVGLLVAYVLKRAGVAYTKRVRLGVSVGALLLLAFWGMPFSLLFDIFGELNGGIEMFVVAGVMMVGAAVMLVMFNAQVLVTVAGLTLGRAGRITPVLKTAVAYPMAARFRTGLTLAMFALIIFTLIVIAILTNTNQAALEKMERVTGGYQVTASVPLEHAIPEIEAALDDVARLQRTDIELVAATGRIGGLARDLRADSSAWQPISVKAADGTYLATNQLELSHFDPAYGANSREIWDAVSKDPSLAVLNTGSLPVRFQQGLEVRGRRFVAVAPLKEDPAQITAFAVQVRDSAGNRPPVMLTVIGVTDELADLLDGSPSLTVRAGVVDALVGRAVPLAQYHFRLTAGADAKDVADALETAFLRKGLQATITEREVREFLSVNTSLNRLFQTFMALGLVVGVAALGVISFRAVVERRQAIGMMKAIGYRPGMIMLGFVLESSVVAVLGILLGIALGSLISWNIVQELGDRVEGLRFAIPWLDVGVIVAFTWGFSILTTIWPARQASKIYAAEALRYE